MANFVAALRNLAEHCEYKDTLEMMLRDRIVCRIRDDKMQQHLLVKKELTLILRRHMRLQPRWKLLPILSKSLEW